MDRGKRHRSHLLIVDDTPMNIEILFDALEDAYEVSFSTSGAEALQLIAESEIPDLILLDVMMPEMDGYEVCRRLKQDVVTRNIPIIFVTAMNSSESESTGLALGADDYITKPINIDVSRLRIKNLLERTRLGHELELTLTCSNQGLWDWDLRSDTVFLDPRWASPLGYAPGELNELAFTWSQLLHPNDFEIMNVAATEHLSGAKEEINVEVRIRNKGNDFCWMQILGKGTTREVCNRPTRVCGTYMDIGLRKRGEIAIKENRNRLATLIDSIPDSVLTFDTHGDLIDLHIPEAQNGLQCVSLWTHRHYSDIFPKELTNALDAGVIASSESLAPQPQEFLFSCNGESRYYAVTVSRLGAPENDLSSGFLAVIRDITQEKLVEDELRQQANHDALTALPNRRLLIDRLRQAQFRSSRNKSFAALMLLDLDKFKQVNDNHGHEVGDKLLIEVTSRLQATLRVNDTIARLGGDEFVVLIERLGVNETEAIQKAKLVVDKLRAGLRQDYRFGDLLLHCTVSIGVRLFLGDGDPAESILQEADLAMYKMKEINTQLAS